MEVFRHLVKNFGLGWEGHVGCLNFKCVALAELLEKKKNPINGKTLKHMH